MIQRFYTRFIKPLPGDVALAEREVVLNFLLMGILVLSSIALLDTIITFILKPEGYLLSRIASDILIVLFVAFLYWWARYKRHERPVAILLLLFVSFFACFSLFQWGLLIPTGILLCSLAIVMGGILINARSALYVAGLITLVMSYLQYGKSTGSIHPDLTWMHYTSTIGDVIGFTAIFFIIGLVSWLFNRQMELSLQRARRSEQALIRQKMLLEITVQKRTQQLEAAHLEQMQELYRFAELGRLSTALFHDLANHLSTINIDIAGLQDKRPSATMQRMQQNVSHIDAVVQRVRRQIQGKAVIEAIIVKDEILEVIKLLHTQAEAAGVIIKFEPAPKLGILLCKGDTTRFRQLVLNLISNAIDSYSDQAAKIVIVKLEHVKTNLILSVSDQGSGISPAAQADIFKPFYTTKEKGMGIGLFIVQQIVEHDFDGTIAVESAPEQGTTFTVTLPRSYYARKNSH